jgi:hypothetical protein
VAAFGPLCGQGDQNKNGGLVILFNEGLKIENPRKYDREAVEYLQHLLKVGSQAQPDPRRKNFYDLDGGSESYYIHVSPVTGSVVLLAKWVHQSQESCPVPESLMAQA